MKPRLLDLCVESSGWRNDDGYAYVSVDGRDRLAHRVAWEAHQGAIPVELEVDHLCRNRACVNVHHLELVTHAENMRRLSLAQTSCRKAGHDWADPRNVYVRKNGRRCCAECARIYAREAWRAKTS